MIELDRIGKIYNKGKANEFIALNEISLSINDGDFICITGKSGAGKSTLLHIIGCIDKATYGSYKLNGQEVSELSDRKLSLYRNRLFGFVMQDYALISDLTAYDNILLPALIKKGKLDSALKKLEITSEKIGIKKILRKPVNILSGGEKQRVSIARALINDPKILIADEPTGNLDSANSETIFDILKNINKEFNVTVIAVTHDTELASRFDKRVIINDGSISEIITENVNY